MLFPLIEQTSLQNLLFIPAFLTSGGCHLISTAGHNSGVLVLREGSVLTWIIDSAGIFISNCEFC